MSILYAQLNRLCYAACLTPKSCYRIERLGKDFGVIYYEVDKDPKPSGERLLGLTARLKPEPETLNPTTRAACKLKGSRECARFALRALLASTLEATGLLLTTSELRLCY